MKKDLRLMPIFFFLMLFILGFTAFQGCEQFKDDMEPGSCIYHYQANDPGDSNSDPTYEPPGQTTTTRQSDNPGAYGGGPSSNAEWGDMVQKRWYTSACIEYNVDEYSADLAKTSCLRSDDKTRVNRRKSENLHYKQKDTDVPTEREYTYDKCNKTSLDGQSLKGKCIWNDITVYYFDNSSGLNIISNQQLCEDRKGSDGKVGVWYAP